MDRNSIVVVTLAIASAHLSSASASTSDAPASTTPEPLVISIEIRDNLPILTATIAGIEIPLKFDLGDGDPLVLQQEVLDQLGAEATGTTAKMRGIEGVFDCVDFPGKKLTIDAADRATPAEG